MPARSQKLVLGKLGIKLVPAPLNTMFSYPSGAASAFCMSIDFDVTSPDRAVQNEEGTRRLLDLSEKYGAPMTWAICGKTAEEYDASYDSILNSRIRQEIANHTYGHIDVSKSSTGQFEEDLDRCAKVLKLPTKPKSFVFPWNREGHFDVLSKKGFVAYRGSERMISHPIERGDGLWNIPPAYHADRSSPCSPSMIRVLIDLTIENHSVFHLWLHPWDLFAKQAEISKVSHVRGLLESVLSYVRNKRDEGKIYISTMGEIADLHSKVNQ